LGNGGAFLVVYGIIALLGIDKMLHGKEMFIKVFFSTRNIVTINANKFGGLFWDFWIAKHRLYKQSRKKSLSSFFEKK
jgi:hypothetical protein